MSNESVQSERGQNLLVFAVLMVVLVALAALVIDGGFSLAKHREAQNAADAGALAGAAALCSGDASLARTQALDYAINHNHATSADVTLATRAISVTATNTHPTFLAGIFGSNTVNASATATAGCFAPCQVTGILPVAWLCHPPVGGPGINNCGIITGSNGQPGPTYIIMDSENVAEDLYCQDPVTHLPTGAMDCDRDNDGVNDVDQLGTGGNRSWMSLDGTNPTNKLRDWMHGYNVPVSPHTWFGGVPGNRTAAYQEATTLINDIVILPVFDDICEGLPSSTCPSQIHTNPPDPWQDIIIGNKNTVYFHVVQFSAFVIKCVSYGSSYCPGKAAAMAINPNIRTNTNTIEGYFIRDYYGSGKCDGPDTGVYTLYLDH
jgi:hypothetical protein